MPALIANTSMDKNCINIIKDYFAGFLEYLADKKEDFVSEYENATAHYISNLEKGIC